jgi:hypothetical protein
LYGVIGAGDAPFLYGVIGAGDAPFAIITELSPCAVTMVFKPIALTNTTNASNTTASFLDMLPPGMERHPETLYPYIKGCQVARAMNLYRIGTHLPGPSLRHAFAWQVRAAVSLLGEDRF